MEASGRDPSNRRVWTRARRASDWRTPWLWLPLLSSTPVIVEEFQIPPARFRPEKRLYARAAELAAHVDVLELSRAEVGQRTLVASDQNVSTGSHLRNDRRQVLFELLY